MSQKWNFKHVTSSPHYPKGNGKAEITVKILKNLIKKTTNASEDITSKYYYVKTEIDYIQSAYRKNLVIDL